MAFTQADYFDLTRAQAAQQWQGILARAWPAAGKRQVPFVPVETLLCLAAMFVVEHTRFGSSSAHRAPEPVQSLARLVKRPPTSIIAKMNNLDGSRSHGASNDLLVGSVLRTDQRAMADLYRVILAAARAEGIDGAMLPDFLGVEGGRDLELLGQDELEGGALESVVEREIHEWLVDDVEERVTERLVVASLRVGQHRFATSVLDSWSHECAFCGFAMHDDVRPTLLRASHIKPWRDSKARERLDASNGFAACPVHDAAFDAGLLTVTDDLDVQVSDRLARTIDANPSARAYFTAPQLRGRVATPRNGRPPGTPYMEWHRTRVFENTPASA
ncbi:hypothetical protein MWU57_10985 [Isoptericola sp. S6320L]|uniref:HNH endonuclease n=1 Tax=Isoptericola sp. S6320L TaxID=2926411 RepID=UPI001FF2B4A9|nr:HNH endonuclease [Isoptericola sp. S6320L]MCK0117556.1 hypothetical protein [Isoptericola sp. S6320L]